MSHRCSPENCGQCPAATATGAGKLVCRCLGVSEEEILAAVTGGDARTIADLRRLTGAGDGCTACVPRLRTYLERVSLPMMVAS